MPKGNIPMRMRRRQSDAKWRASVALCYDTLKMVIPNNEKMSKRKISKALVLQETEKHIENLERTLHEILEQRAKSKDKAVLYQTELGLVEANVGDIRNDFSLQQQDLYYQNFGQRKRSKCNIPSDMESGLINLRSSACELTVVPAECLQNDLTPVTAQVIQNIPLTSSHQVANKSCTDLNQNVTKFQDEGEDAQVPVFMDAQSFLKATMEQDPEIQALCLSSVNDDIVGIPAVDLLLRTPVKTSSGRETTPSTRKFPDFGSCQWNEHAQKEPEEDSYRTPTSTKGFQSRSSQSQEHRILKKTPGFTPVKLPENMDQGVPASGLYPVYKENDIVDEEEIKLADLFCTESIEHMDLGDEDDIPRENQQTPELRQTRYLQRMRKQDRARSRSISQGRPKSEEAKCRRQLEKSFHNDKKHSDESDENVNVDGFQLFYQQIMKEHSSNGMTDPDFEKHISQLWNEMTEDAHNTYVTMATLQNSNSDCSNLSSDLFDLYIKPIPPDPEEMLNNQVVPTVENECEVPTARDSSPEGRTKLKELSICTSDDLGFFVAHRNNKSDENGLYFTGSELSSQVVPEFDPVCDDILYTF